VFGCVPESIVTRRCHVTCRDLSQFVTTRVTDKRRDAGHSLSQSVTDNSPVTKVNMITLTTPCPHCRKYSEIACNNEIKVPGKIVVIEIECPLCKKTYILELKIKMSVDPLQRAIQ
jgi:transposase-like protein